MAFWQFFPLFATYKFVKIKVIQASGVQAVYLVFRLPEWIQQKRGSGNTRLFKHTSILFYFRKKNVS
jgi:hypothetical protein